MRGLERERVELAKLEPQRRAAARER